MKITAIHFEGFGIFSEARLAPLPPGLIVINAANGGGKTTLRDFLRACLFRFPDRRGDANRYERASGAHGGSLEFTLKDGAGYRLAFDASTNKQALARHDGAPSGEASLLFGSATRGLYQNIFAIGLPELQDAAFLSGDQIHSMIGGFGSGQSGKVFQQARSAFSKEAEEHFKPGGKVPLFNKDLAAHEELVAELARSRAEADEYWSYETRLDELKEQIAARSAAEAALRLRHQHLHALKQAWPDWVALTRIRGQLAVIQPNVQSFPTDGTGRLAGITAEMQTHGDNLNRRHQEQKQATQKLESLVVNQLLLDHGPAIDEANEGCRLHEGNLEKRAKLQDDLGRATASLNEETARLGPGGASHLETFDSAVAPMAEMAEAARQLTDAQRLRAERATALQGQARRLAGAAAEAEKARAEFTAKWPEAPPEQTAIDARLAGLSRIRTALSDAARLRDNAAHADQAVAAATEDLARSRQRLKEATENPASAPAPDQRPAKSVAVAIPIFLGGIIMAALAYQTPVIAAAMFVVATALALAVYLMGRTAPATQATAIPAYLQQDVDASQTKLDAARQVATIAATQQGTAEATLGELCQAFAKKPLQSPDCDELETKLMQLRERRRLYEIDAQQLRVTGDKSADLTKERTHQEEEMAATEIAVAAAQARWDAWLQLQKLEPGLSPASAEAFVRQIETARAALKTCQALAAEIELVTAGLDAYIAGITELLATLGRPAPTAADLKRVLTALRDERDQARQNLVARAGLIETIAQAAPEIEDLNRKLEAAAARQAGLLREAGAADAAEFALRAAAWATRTEFLSAERAALEKLELLSAPGEAAARFQAELSALDNETLQRDYASAETELGELREELAALNRDQGQTAAHREHLADSNRVAELQQALQASEANLRDLADEWAVRKLAFWLLEKARAEIETARQPQVLQSAGACLTTMSNGRFTGIVQPLGTSDLHVIESGANGAGDRRRDKPHTWNTALKEKTYLSLRFGLIDSYSAQAEPLPIILDDALVNLDPANCAGALRCIDEMAQRHQIFYLTCHPHALHHFAALPTPPAYYEIRGGAFHQAALPPA